MPLLLPSLSLGLATAYLCIWLTIDTGNFQGFSFAEGALPPGFEDELYCPDGYCLKRKASPPNLVGPKAYFWECRKIVDKKSGKVSKESIVVTPWGPKLADAVSIKDKLLADGFSTSRCKSSEPDPVIDIEGKLTHTVIAFDEGEDENNFLGSTFSPWHLVGIILSALFLVGFCIASAIFSSSSSRLGSAGLPFSENDHLH